MTFGDIAIGMGWFPNGAPRGSTAASEVVEGRTDAERRARAAAMVAACHVAP